MLKQSECAVKRVVEELSRQYREWDSMKQRQQRGKFGTKQCKCPCTAPCRDTIDMSDVESNGGFKEDYDVIVREKEKLENAVKELQNERFGEGCQRQITALRRENEKLQEALKREMEKCKKLERKLN